jgi:hypothetical protein
MFCSKCGTNLGGGSNSSIPSVDNDKVLKDGEFRHFVKSLDALSKKNDGSLTLYNNRLSWKGGKGDFEIPVNDIKDVKVTASEFDGILEILTNDGNINKFMIKREGRENKANVFNALAAGAAAGATHGTSSLINAQNVRAKIEPWREAIEKVRGRQ